MDSLYAEICCWENLLVAHRREARKHAAATFEYNLAESRVEVCGPGEYRAGPALGLRYSRMAGVGVYRPRIREWDEAGFAYS